LPSRDFGDHTHHHSGNVGSASASFHSRCGPDAGLARDKRVFKGGELKLLILGLLAEKDRHGYEIIKEIGERVGGDYRPSSGVVYPTLRLLLEMSCVSANYDAAGRKLYKLTAEGEKLIAENKTDVDALFGRFGEDELTKRASVDSISRALRNLDAAARLRLYRRAITPPQLQAIVDTLEALAKTIEQT
jgi:DNA-binding PadR family transcriptional regulator